MERNTRAWLLAGGLIAAGLFLSAPSWFILWILRTRPQLFLPDERIQAAVQRALNADIHDLELARHRKALLEAADFVDEHLAGRPGFSDRYQLLRHSLERVDPKIGGLYCEFGVGQGDSVNFIASVVPQQKLHGFDSFEGLPENWRDGHGKGTFKTSGLPRVLPNVVLHKGWFHESLPGFKQKHPEPAAFFHLDADLYSSTKTVFDILGDQVVAGSVLVFDEFIGYPGWRQGEFRAFREFAEARGLEYEYLGYCQRGQQVALRVIGTGRPGAREVRSGN